MFCTVLDSRTVIAGGVMTANLPYFARKRRRAIHHLRLIALVHDVTPSAQVPTFTVNARIPVPVVRTRDISVVLARRKLFLAGPLIHRGQKAAEWWHAGSNRACTTLSLLNTTSNSIRGAARRRLAEQPPRCSPGRWRGESLLRDRIFALR